MSGECLWAQLARNPGLLGGSGDPKDPLRLGQLFKSELPDGPLECDTFAHGCDHPRTNGVIGRWFGTLKYEHEFRGVITDGDALDMEVHRFRIV
jgi:hypothetical protein